MVPLGFGLLRRELVDLEFTHLQQRENSECCPACPASAAQINHRLGEIKVAYLII